MPKAFCSTAPVVVEPAKIDATTSVMVVLCRVSAMLVEPVVVLGYHRVIINAPAQDLASIEKDNKAMLYDSPAFSFDLQAAGIILFQDSQNTVIGMFADAPDVTGFVRGLKRRVVENAKERQRLSSVSVGKVTFLKSQAERDACHQNVAKPCHFGYVIQHSFAKQRNICRKQVAPVHRCSGFDQRMIVVKFFAEVESFFLIRLAGGEFVATGK